MWFALRCGQGRLLIAAYLVFNRRLLFLVLPAGRGVILVLRVRKLGQARFPVG